jgi:hypothetical protein
MLSQELLLPANPPAVQQGGMSGPHMAHVLITISVAAATHIYGILTVKLAMAAELRQQCISSSHANHL